MINIGFFYNPILIIQDEPAFYMICDNHEKKFLYYFYIISSVGRFLSACCISDSLSGLAEYFEKQEYISIRTETLNNYLQILENAKIIYKCLRFDVKSKKSLRGEQKYYLADLGIYFSRNVDARINYGPVLENIVYTYLSAKKYKMSVGHIGKLECDFITRISDEYRYIQVAMTIMGHGKALEGMLNRYFKA